MGRQVHYAEFPHKADEKSSPVAESSSSEQVRLLLDLSSRTPLDASQHPDLPEWFDLGKFKTGQEYFYKNYYSLFIAKLCGLLTILSIPSISRVLVMTRQSSQPVTAFKRYVATIAQMMLWYEGDLLEPTSSAHKSLAAVRSRHSAASYRARKSGLAAISQLDMVLTQFGFMGFAITSPRKLGLVESKEGVEGFVHFWRVIGHLMGIEDRFNLCRETVGETKLRCQALVDQAFVPGFQNSSKDFDSLSRALVAGMWCMVPFLDYTAFFAFIKGLVGITTKDTNDNNNQKEKEYTLAECYSLFLFHLMNFVQVVLFNNFYVGWLCRMYFNYQMRLTVYLTLNCPFLAYAVHGRMEIKSPMTYH